MGMGLAEGCAAEERREWCKSGPPGTLFVPIAGDLLPVRELNFAREKQPQPGRPVATVRSLSIMVRLVDRNRLLTPRKAGPLLGYGNRFFFGMGTRQRFALREGPGFGTSPIKAPRMSPITCVYVWGCTGSGRWC